MEALSQVQAPDDVLSHLTSITEVQTRGVKRVRETGKADDEDDSLLPSVSNKKKIVINSISGSKRRHLLSVDSKTLNSNDPNIVGFQVRFKFLIFFFL